MLVVDQARRGNIWHPEERKTQFQRLLQCPHPQSGPATALGIALGCAGLVTHMAVSMVGLVLFVVWSAGGGCPAGGATRGSAGASLERQAAPVQTRLHAVAHLRLGERGHRVRIPTEIHPYSAGIKGGIVGGIVAIVAVAYGDYRPW